MDDFDKDSMVILELFENIVKKGFDVLDLNRNGI